MDHYSESCDSLDALGFGEVEVPAPPPPSPEQGERRLLTSLLQEAAQTYKDHALSDTRRGQRLFREAEAWFSASETEAPLSFAYVCDALDIDAARFRAKLESWRHRALASVPSPANVAELKSAGGNRVAGKTTEISTARSGGRPDVTLSRCSKALPHRSTNPWQPGNGRPAADIKGTSKRQAQLLSTGAAGITPVVELRKGIEKMDPTRFTKTLKRAAASPAKKEAPGRAEHAPAAGKEKDGQQRFDDDGFVLLGYVGMCPEGIHGYQLSKMLSRPPLQLPCLRLGRLYRVLRRLESAGLLASHVEADGGRLRYRFTITSEGESCFRRWLTRPPSAAEATADHLLERLRFARLLSERELSRLFESAEEACRTRLEEFGRGTASDAGPDAETPHLYALAQEARLEDELRWLEKVRVLAAGQAPQADWEDEYVAATAVA